MRIKAINLPECELFLERGGAVSEGGAREASSRRGLQGGALGKGLLRATSRDTDTSASAAQDPT